MSIHSTAIVAEGAVVPASCTVGPFCTIGPNVVLGEGCELVSHVVLDGHTTFGARNKIFSFACLGIAPQDLKYAGEPTRAVKMAGVITVDGKVVSDATITCQLVPRVRKPKSEEAKIDEAAGE